jgi:hypothetical protein
LPVFACASGDLAPSDAGDSQMPVCDLREAAIFSDGQALQIWVDFDPGDWHDEFVLGLTIDRSTSAGGILDPTGAQIRWDDMDNKPDYFASLNLGNDFQQLRRWNGSSWVFVRYGYGALDWFSEGALHAVALPLADIGAPQIGDVLNVEIWVNLTSPSSGALDLLASDDVQESTPAGTRWVLEDSEWTRPSTWQQIVVGGSGTAVPLSPADDPAGAADARSGAHLLGAWPNPFNPATEIAFSLPAAADVELAIYAPSGRLVALPVKGRFAAGEHQAAWAGRDLAGDPLPSGIYLAALRADVAEVGRIKLVLAK